MTIHRFRGLRRLAICLLFAITGLLGVSIPQTWASTRTRPFTEPNIIRAIIGEAGPSYAEKFAIAHAIRNRGTLKGVYGHVANPTAKQWQAGSRAWHESAYTQDPTHGASHWLSAYDLKYCRPAMTKFRLGMVETAYIANTHFYKTQKN